MKPALGREIAHLAFQLITFKRRASLAEVVANTIMILAQVIEHSFKRFLTALTLALSNSTGLSEEEALVPLWACAGLPGVATEEAELTLAAAARRVVSTDSWS